MYYKNKDENENKNEKKDEDKDTDVKISYFGQSPSLHHHNFETNAAFSFFTEMAPRPIQSISCNVIMPACVCRPTHSLPWGSPMFWSLIIFH